MILTPGRARARRCSARKHCGASGVVVVADGRAARTVRDCGAGRLKSIPAPSRGAQARTLVTLAAALSLLVLPFLYSPLMPVPDDHPVHGAVGYGAHTLEAPTTFLPPLFAPAYGHGLGVDRIPSISVGDQRMNILVEMPQEFEGGDAETITVTAIDAVTEQPVAYDVTYLLGVSHGNQTVFRDYFVAEGGVLRLDVETAGAGEVYETPAITGVRDGAHPNAWRPMEGRDSVRVDGSSFGLGGLYTFDVTVHSIGGGSGDAVAGPADAYYADLSVVESVSYEQADSEGNAVPFGTKSYFDRIGSLVYDSESGEVAIVMPFDWRESRMSHIPVIHVETHFPKDFLEFRSPGYEGYVNDVRLFKSSVITDDYTMEDERIVHFVLLQDHVRLVKNEIKKSGEPFPDTMTLKLRMAEQLEFPLVAYTVSEDFLVNLSWDPPEIQPGQETTFVFTIRDGATREPLRNSEYTFVVVQDDEEIFRTSGEARIGGQFVKYTFGEDQTGPTAIRFENIRGTGQDTEFGILVVPEFGSVAMFVLAAATAATLSFALWRNRGMTASGLVRTP